MTLTLLNKFHESVKECKQLTNTTSTTDKILITLSQYLYIYVGFLAFVVGSIGNICNIVVFTGIRKYRLQPSSLFLAGASIGEQLAILALILPQSIASATGFDFRAKSSASCRISSFFYTGGGVLAISCLYLAAADRYLQTCRSATKRQWMTLKKSRQLFCAAICLGVLTGLPFALFRDVIPLTMKCDYNDVTFTHISFYFYALVGIVSPLGLLVILVVLTWRNLKMTREHQITNRNNNFVQHVARVILAQTIVIVVSILPGAAINLYGILFNRDSLMATPTEVFILTVTQILTYSNSCTSFYFYVFLSSAFRRNILTIVWYSKLWDRNRVIPLVQQTRSINHIKTEHADHSQAVQIM